MISVIHFGDLLQVSAAAFAVGLAVGMYAWRRLAKQMRFDYSK